MSDEGFDICEYVFNHQTAMRRLLSFLRQSQTYCTDTECLDELPPMTGERNAGDTSFVMIAMCWMVVALVFFLLRPRTLRNKSDNSNPNFSRKDGDGRPPLPPTVN